LWRGKLGGNKKGREGAEEEYGFRRHRHHICSSTTSFLLSLSLSLSLLILCHVIALEKKIAEGIFAKTEFDKR
jgi:hypothetical protein